QAVAAEAGVLPDEAAENRGGGQAVFQGVVGVRQLVAEGRGHVAEAPQARAERVQLAVDDERVDDVRRSPRHGYAVAVEVGQDERPVEHRGVDDQRPAHVGEAGQHHRQVLEHGERVGAVLFDGGVVDAVDGGGGLRDGHAGVDDGVVSLQDAAVGRDQDEGQLHDVRGVRVDVGRLGV